MGSQDPAAMPPCRASRSTDPWNAWPRRTIRDSRLPTLLLTLARRARQLRAALLVQLRRARLVLRHARAAEIATSENEAREVVAEIARLLVEHSGARLVGAHAASVRVGLRRLV